MQFEEKELSNKASKLTGVSANLLAVTRNNAISQIICTAVTSWIFTTCCCPTAPSNITLHYANGTTQRLKLLKALKRVSPP